MMGMIMNPGHGAMVVSSGQSGPGAPAGAGAASAGTGATHSPGGAAPVGGIGGMGGMGGVNGGRGAMVPGVRMQQPTRSGVGASSGDSPWALHDDSPMAMPLACVPDSSTEDKRGLMREEWSDDATDAIIDEWGVKHLSLNRGKLKRQDWDEVAEKVSRRLGGGRNVKTWLQCKNKIDSIKKKYKQVRYQRSAGLSKKSWRLYEKVDDLLNPGHRLDVLSFPGDDIEVHHLPSGIEISEDLEQRDMRDCGDNLGGDQRGDVSKPNNLLPSVNEAMRHENGVGSPSVGNTFHFAQDPKMENPKKRKGNGNPVKELARSIRHFSQVYERVETSKQEKMFELEKLRMAFTKELENQRMRVQFEIAKLTSGKGIGDFPII